MFKSNSDFWCVSHSIWRVATGFLHTVYVLPYSNSFVFFWTSKYQYQWQKHLPLSLLLRVYRVVVLPWKKILTLKESMKLKNFAINNKEKHLNAFLYCMCWLHKSQKTLQLWNTLELWWLGKCLNSNQMDWFGRKWITQTWMSLCYPSTLFDYFASSRMLHSFSADDYWASIQICFPTCWAFVFPAYSFSELLTPFAPYLFSATVTEAAIN